jgi:hypothetical protein
MARDIEEFLRRAAERRKQNQGGGGAVPPKAPPVARPPQAPPKKRLAEEASLPTEDPYARKKQQAARPQAPPRKPAPPAPRPQRKRESIEEHVRRAIVVSDVTENASHLAEDISQADERLEARLEKFDHSMGSLEGTGTVTDDETAKVEGPDKSQLAVDLIGLLRAPKTIRQSILISEILKRPDFDDE